MAPDKAAGLLVHLEAAQADGQVKHIVALPRLGGQRGNDYLETGIQQSRMYLVATHLTAHAIQHAYTSQRLAIAPPELLDALKTRAQLHATLTQALVKI